MKPKIIIGIETLVSGGAEAFVVRMANGLCPYYEVTVFVFYHDKIDERLINRTKREFHLEIFKTKFDLLIRKTDALLVRLKIDLSLRSHLIEKQIKKILLRDSISVIHSNQFKVDYIFYKANKNLKLHHITTIHGDYLNFYSRSKRKNFSILNYQAKAKAVLSAVDRIVYISNHQLNFITNDFQLPIKEKAKKIYNGIDLSEPFNEIANISFQRKKFVFGMIARAIPEKGWEIAIESFLILNRPETQLILVGEGEYLNQLKHKYNYANIHFVGYSSTPLNWISLFDVGLLPSTFASESLPTTIIEYLAMGKPVVASDKGEIRNMLVQNESVCGILLPIQEEMISRNQLKDAMQKLMDNDALYQKMAIAAKENVKIFDIKNCVQSYLKLYNNQNI